jgi:type IV pilus assembly protein PilN
VICGKLLYGGWIDAQNEKNALLKRDIVKLDAQIADIQDLETRKQRLVARMEIIEKLQRKRPEIVHLFDEIVKTVPEGIYLTSLKESGNKLEVHGVAQSSTRVSTWMDNPVLQVVESGSAANGGSTFTLTADVVGVDLEGGGETKVKKVAQK